MFVPNFKILLVKQFLRNPSRKKVYRQTNKHPYWKGKNYKNLYTLYTKGIKMSTELDPD